MWKYTLKVLRAAKFIDLFQWRVQVEKYSGLGFLIWEIIFIEGKFDDRSREFDKEKEWSDWESES